MTGVDMASDNGGDLGAHAQTYSGFIGLLKWGTAATAVVAICVILLISS